VVAHDPFHVVKRANKAIDELRRRAFFRAGPKLRALGRGKRWLFLRAWENCSDKQQAELRRLLAGNGKLARAYQVREELRAALRAPDQSALAKGLAHVLCRTQLRANVPMRKLHDSLVRHSREIVALGEHHPPTGRIEALNNNWETLVRAGRGYRDLDFLFLKLRFVTVNPLAADDGVRRFLAMGLPVPDRKAA
jgi:transposase